MNWRTRAATLRRASRKIVMVAILGAAAAGSARAQTTSSTRPLDLGSFTNDIVRRELALRQQELELFRQRNDLQNQLSREFQNRGLSFQPTPLTPSTSFLNSLQALSNQVPGGLSAVNRSDLSSLFNKERELMNANRRFVSPSAISALDSTPTSPFTFNPVFNVESNSNAVSNNDNVLRNDPRTNVNNQATSDLDSRFDLATGRADPGTAAGLQGTRAFAQPSFPSFNGSNPAFNPLDPFNSARTTTPNVFSRPMNDIGNINPIDRQKMQFPGQQLGNLTPSQQAERDRFFENMFANRQALEQNPNQDPSRFSNNSASDTASRLRLGANLDQTPGTSDDSFPFGADFQTGARTQTGSSGTGTLNGNIMNQADARSTIQTNFGPAPGTTPGTSFPGFSANLSSDSRSRSGLENMNPPAGTSTMNGFPQGNAFAPGFPPGNASGLSGRTDNQFPPGNAFGTGGRFDNQFPPGNAFGLRQGLQPQTSPDPGTNMNTGTGVNSGMNPGM